MVVAKNSVNGAVVKNNINRKQTWWVQEDIIKVWLEGLWLSSVFNIFKILTLRRISPRYLYLNHLGGAYFHWSRSLKACSIAKRTCLSCVWMAIFPKSYLKFRHRICFEQGAPWHSGNYKVKIYSESVRVMIITYSYS